MIRRPPRSTQSRSSAASDVYKRQVDLVQPHQVLNIFAVASAYHGHGYYPGERAHVLLHVRGNHRVLGPVHYGSQSAVIIQEHRRFPRSYASLDLVLVVEGGGDIRSSAKILF